MIILLSPSKTLDFESPTPKIAATQPEFLRESEFLIKALRKKSVADLQKLMDLSPKLAQLNVDRYKAFHTPFTPKNARPCIFAFKGDVYEGLDVESFSTAMLKSAQAELRILSGLYGLLRPFDLIQPYRLEMGTRLATSQGKNLYSFWGDHLTHKINEALALQKDKTVINLASEEYFGAVNPENLTGKVVTPIFKEAKGNQLKVIGLFAKKARGMMARHLLSGKNLQSFNMSGYKLEPDLSTPLEVVFVRKLQK